MDFKRTKKIIIDFAEEVVRLAKKNAMKQKVTGELRRSISYNETVSGKGSFELDFLMLKYGKFQDAGVDGVINKRGTRKYKLPIYSYKRKGGPDSLQGMPPIAPLLKWANKKKLRLRNKKTGRFMKGGQKTLAFLIARNIFYKGLEPTYFFTEAFEKAYKKLPEEFLDAYALDTGDFIEFTMKNIK